LGGWDFMPKMGIVCVYSCQFAFFPSKNNSVRK
jgi:hypothetical protein